MEQGRTSCLLLNLFYVSVVLTALTNWAAALFLTIALFCVLHLNRIPAIPGDAVKSRLQLPTNFVSSIILHRAGAVDTPENTLAGVKKAAECCVAGVEVDLEFTADGVGVLLHDSTVDRTTDGCGPICNLKYDDVKKLDAGAKHSCRSACGPEPIPSLEECLEHCLRLDLTIYIDCKSQPQKTADLMCQLFKKYPKLYNKAVVCSFYPQVVYYVRKKDPSILTGLTHRHRVLSTLGADGASRSKEWWRTVVASVLDVLLEWSHYAWFWYLCGNSFFLVNKDDLSSNGVRFWRSLDIQVIPWTVNNPREKEYFMHCLKCPIITDGMDTQ